MLMLALLHRTSAIQRGAQLLSNASGSENATSTFQPLPRPARVRKMHTGSIVSRSGQSLAGGMIYDDSVLPAPDTEPSDLGPASFHIYSGDSEFCHVWVEKLLDGCVR